MIDNEYFYSELGMVKQICDLENGQEIIRDRETGECINFSNKCSECDHYHEEWNLMSYINGLNWILEDDKFGFGNNWEKGTRPETEEENAGYIITRVLEFLHEELEKHKNIGLIQSARWTVKEIPNLNDLIDDGK